MGERIKGKVAKDGIEGWVTMKGNAGTTYAKAIEKVYTVRKAVDLQEKFQSESPVVRTLAIEETVQVLEGPKEEKFTPVNRMKVRAAGDSAVGWLTVTGDNVRAWKPFYKYVKASALYTAKGLRESV